MTSYRHTFKLAVDDAELGIREDKDVTFHITQGCQKDLK